MQRQALWHGRLSYCVGCMNPIPQCLGLGPFPTYDLTLQECTPWAVAGGGSRTWVSATCAGDQWSSWYLASALVLTVAGMWGSESADGRSLWNCNSNK